MWNSLNSRQIQRYSQVEPTKLKSSIFAGRSKPKSLGVRGTRSKIKQPWQKYFAISSLRYSLGCDSSRGWVSHWAQAWSEHVESICLLFGPHCIVRDLVMPSLLCEPPIVTCGACETQREKSPGALTAWVCLLQRSSPKNSSSSSCLYFYFIYLYSILQDIQITLCFMLTMLVLISVVWPICS